MGRIESDNMFTRDAIHVDVALVVDSDWIAVNKTTEAVVGGNSQNAGRYWTISGQPKTISRAGGRRAEHRALEAIQVFTAPEEITQHYA